MTNPNIYVMAIDRGCEGHSPPIQAFTDYAIAKAALAIVKADPASGNWQLFRVPCWPELATASLEIKPIEANL